MQYTRTFFSIACISLGFAVAPGCEADSTNGGGGGDGGDGQWTGSGGAGVGSTGSSMSGSTSSGSMGGDVEPATMNGMTAAHNMARANVNPSASTPIPPLTWSSEVAAVAQAYAENCVFKHSSNSYGENLYATTGGGSPQDVVGSWVSEVSDYNYGSNSCSGVCGHYTQVVWANTLRLGCGTAQCTKNSPFGGGSWEIWVCNYDPPGNWSGQKPY
jgi:hypothetical protein